MCASGRRLTALVVLFLLVTLCVGAEEPQPDEMIAYKTVGDVVLKLHVFRPEDHAATDKRSCIVFFFGGGWNSGSPSQFYPQ